MSKNQTINQKEYLRKYLSIGKEPGAKKKKKKKPLPNVKIIDDDLDNETIDLLGDDPFETNEDAPQIVAVIDERPPSMRTDDLTKDNLWKPLGSAPENNTQNLPSVNKFKIGGVQNKGYLDSKINKIDKNRKQTNQTRNAKNIIETSPGRSKSKCDISPSRRKEKGDLEDYSPPKRKHKSESSEEYGRDISPPRKRRGEEKDRDIAPPTKKRVEEKDRCSSPARKRRGEDDDRDISPPRKKRDEEKDRATSPPRKRIGEEEDRDISPPRKKRDKEKDRDISPPRKRRDLSPQRRRKNEESDENNSPVRGNKKDTSNDVSPPRRSKKDLGSDMSRIRKPSRWGSCDEPSSPTHKERSSQSDSDSSPPRKHKRMLEPGDKYKKSRTIDEECSSKMKKTLDGKAAGLQTAGELVKELKQFKSREDELFNKLSTEESGANARAVLRDRRTGRIRDLQQEMCEKKKKEEEENKKKEIYDRWGRGLKQVEQREKRTAEIIEDMSKPLARYADDEDLEKHLKEREVEGDPMLAYLRKKKRKRAIEQPGYAEKPQYMGEFMPNRYGIQPGHRWDGVDRSNGYEKKYFEMQNKRNALIEESHKWSTEDM